ncbi:MAG: pyrroline-5-carboxylate reductase [Rhodospirillales bacterium]|nr:pyrroline-5-carboxylate reductase [Rhodospirillales bacterium]MBT4038432.1 pyrroline-5-carboxylate reductase [Rhodospirillales bacterium]MBT4625699.1 pyrroline-5-carboxylate reductase [Rhodospirillales bacterium]MBT5352365.1 pyrroline-5-carboxylate reductase [Rhodospirillales bacterium]MBT5519811.1 pyrroline-5-carboxylate reductase [Rhodospirillales bacterium]
MGGALLEGWLQQGIPASDIIIVEPNTEIGMELTTQHGVSVLSSAGALSVDLNPAVVMMAVKPQVMDDVAPAYARFASSSTVFLSIAAGKNIQYFASMFGSDAAIVRAMPNTPAAVGRGITVCCANEPVRSEQRDVCTRLLEAVGTVDWVEDEGLIDAVTGLSGGGPAYVFLLVESLAKAGVAAGLPEDLAMRLARQTVAGSGELLHQSEEEPATLRKNVTSPGGTTAEALRVLMGEDDRDSRRGWQSLITDAVAAATNRSRELAD